MNRRELMQWTALGALAAKDALAKATAPAPVVVAPGGQRAVVTPNGSTLPLKLINGVKVGHLIAEEFDHEIAPGLKIRAWGYNGSTPGPTLEVTEGDRVRLYVTNRLPEVTSVHWHGVILPNGMDGVAGLTQTPMQPGETYLYEFTFKRAGTFMYHPHADEMTQMALGMNGMIVVHPKAPKGPRVDRDFVLMAHEWLIHPGTMRPDPNAMADFNVLTFNSKAFPATAPLVMGVGERVRVRVGNLSPMDHHPIHLHGVSAELTWTDGGEVPLPLRPCEEHEEVRLLLVKGVAEHLLETVGRVLRWARVVDEAFERRARVLREALRLLCPRHHVAQLDHARLEALRPKLPRLDEPEPTEFVERHRRQDARTWGVDEGSSGDELGVLLSGRFFNSSDIASACGGRVVWDAERRAVADAGDRGVEMGDAAIGVDRPRAFSSRSRSHRSHSSVVVRMPGSQASSFCTWRSNERNSYPRYFAASWREIVALTAPSECPSRRRERRPRDGTIHGAFGKPRSDRVTRVHRT